MNQRVTTIVFAIAFASILGCFTPIAISPDGQRVAYVGKVMQDGSGVYTGNVDGSDFKYLGESSAGSVQWSPDGKKFATLTATELNVKEENRVHTWKIIEGFVMRWSPDSKSIAVLSEDSITVVKMDDILPLYKVPHPKGDKYKTGIIDIKWLSNDAFLVAVSPNLYRVEFGEVTRLPNYGDIAGLDVEPNGTLLLAKADIEKKQTTISIGRSPLMPNGQYGKPQWKKVIQRPTQDMWVEFSPQRDRFAFMWGSKTTTCEVASLDGSKAKLITKDGGRLFWFPDGQRIALVRDKENERFAVWDGKKLISIRK